MNLHRAGIAALLIAGTAPACGASAGSGEPPVRFLSEVVRLVVGVDSLTVEGTYRLLCRAGGPRGVPILYPYPSDDMMGGARTVILEGRSPAGPWRSLAFREVPGGLGAVWTIPMDLADTLEVRTVYRQALDTMYARYIVTTTRSWGQPLERARFEIFLPRGARAESFSFPFTPGDCRGRPCYIYETTRFMPDRDIEVRWRIESPDKP
jgi:hypothetical protein